MSDLSRLHREVIGCRLCPRLVAHRETVAREKRRAYAGEEYWGRPVPGFGDPRARLLIVGLAPGAHGANRTGRMFTGDASGDFLYAALHRAGLASSPRSESRDDGLRLIDCYITAPVRCVPPANKPNRDEIERCRDYLLREVEILSRVEVILALGRIAFESSLRLIRDRHGLNPRPKPRFSHGAVVDLGREAPRIVASYHVSRQNTQTGKLTPEMFDRAIALARPGATRRRGAKAGRSRSGGSRR